MIKGKKVIIFDLDGTLIDSIGIWNEIDIELIKRTCENSIDTIDVGKQRDNILKKYSKCADTYLEYCGFLKQKYGSKLTKEEIKQIRYEIADEYLKNVIDYKPGAENLLRYLKEKRFILVIASTTNDHTIEIYRNHNMNIINKANFDDMFSLIYSKGAVRELKPSPQIHYKVLESLNVCKDDCIIIEDSLIGVEAANNAKIDVAVIYDKYSDGNRKKINELANYRFDDFKQMLDYVKSEIE